MTDNKTQSELAQATVALECTAVVIESGAISLAQASRDPENRSQISPSLLDENQVLAYDLAHTAGAHAAGRAMLDAAEVGPLESALARYFISESLAELCARVAGRSELWGVDSQVLAPAFEFLDAHRRPSFAAKVADLVETQGTGPAHLGDDLDLAAQTFYRFGAEKIAPSAERVHRTNADVPEEIISGLGELGAFGLSVPEKYGGSASGGPQDALAMVVATEELSRSSLGIGGSLVTRPEILTRALLAGGTEAQRERWLPQIASGEKMVGVMVTEPDFGSDVASLGVAATPQTGPDGTEGWVINGTKTWATFAGRAELLMVLARTDPDRASGHRGLSLFVVEKPPAQGHSFSFDQAGGGRIEGRAIDTIGYRGMHSFEVNFSQWCVPADALVGGEAGLGRGFYLQMEGFENGRLQTAARAVGVMQAAFDAAFNYALDRKVFGRAIGDYQLTRVKLARMAALTRAGRQSTYAVARSMGSADGGSGTGGAGSGAGSAGDAGLHAAMVKAYTCRAAEWVTREAMQIHGGMGYAEEYAVSRYFVDARVLSIFEGADETLCLKVIARRLAQDALANL